MIHTNWYVVELNLESKTTVLTGVLPQVRQVALYYIGLENNPKLHYTPLESILTENNKKKKAMECKEKEDRTKVKYKNV